MSELLDAALSLAARGLPVFRLRSKDKRPAFEGWQAEATTDPDQIRALWGERDYNIGVKCGAGLLVLDVDVKNGKPGLENLIALALDLDTYTVKTPSGGYHAYFTGPDVGNSAGRIADGLDVRSLGGYVVGEGSVLPGGRYELVRGRPFLPAPPAILLRCVERRTGSPTLPLVELDDTAAVLRGRDYLRETAPVAVEAKGGDHQTFVVAATLKDFGLSEETALGLMLEHWNERCSPPWESEDLKTKVSNAYHYGANPPGSDHPQAIFGDVQIEAASVVRPDLRWFRHGDAWNKEQAWLFYETLPACGTAVIVGPPNCGKTFLEIEMARCGATGKAFFNVEPDEKFGTVFLFAGTEGSGLPIRLAALQEDEMLPISATTVDDLSGRGALDALVVTLKAEAARMELLFGIPLRLVVLETLSASGLLLDENSNAEAARAMANLGKIALALGVLFVTVAHPPKNGNGPRGAGALSGGPDAIIEITREGRDILRKVDLIKARNAEQRMLGSFTLLPVQIGEDSRGRPVRSMVISMGEPIRVSSRTPKNMEAFSHALEFATDEADVVEGSRKAEREAVLHEFGQLGVFNDRFAKSRDFKVCKEFAVNMGALEVRVIHGVEYFIRKDME